jgi:hypothetical protein
MLFGYAYAMGEGVPELLEAVFQLYPLDAWICGKANGFSGMCYFGRCGRVKFHDNNVCVLQIVAVLILPPVCPSLSTFPQVEIVPAPMALLRR